MILKIQNSLYSKFLSLFLIMTMVLYTNQSLFASNTITKITDSKEFFRALFFLDSQLLDKTPNLKVFKVENILTSKPDLIKYREHINSIMAQIEKNDPSFFQTFAREVTSGNQLRVKSAMDLGAKQIEIVYNENINSKLKSSDYTKTSGDFLSFVSKNNLPTDTYTQKADAVKKYLGFIKNNQTQNLASVTIVIAAALVALLIIVVTVAIAVDGLFWDGTPANRMGRVEGLVNDEIVNEIAVNFNGIF